MTMIYHITARNAALTARQSGEYRTESLAEAGFIHLSQLHQVLGVANAFYVGQKDLVILVVDPSRLKAELKYEAPAHPSVSDPVDLTKSEGFSHGKSLNDSNGLIGTDPSADQLFPHLYGALNFDAVIRVVDFPPLADGKFELPSEIQ